MCRQMLTNWLILALTVIFSFHNTSCESAKEVGFPIPPCMCVWIYKRSQVLFFQVTHSELSAQKRFTLNYHDLVQRPKVTKSKTKRFTLNFHDLYSNEDLKRFYRPTYLPTPVPTAVGSPKYHLRHYYSGLWPQVYSGERGGHHEDKRFTTGFIFVQYLRGF